MNNVIKTKAPKDVLDQIVKEAFPDDAVNMGAQQKVAKQQLVLQLISEVYGENDPITQICFHRQKIARLLYPVNLDVSRADAVEEELSQMEHSWEQLKSSVNQEIMGIRDAFQFN